MKKKIMLDMDDVIVEGGFLYLINQFLGTHYKETDFKDYYMQDIIPNKELFFDYFFEQNMYDHAHLLPHVKEVLQSINEQYDVYIATSYIVRDRKEASATILPHKFHYLLEQFPFLKPEQIIFIQNKKLLNCDIKIDDKIENLDNAEQKYLFTAYHNQSITDLELKKQGIERVTGWLELADKLLK